MSGNERDVIKQVYLTNYLQTFNRNHVFISESKLLFIKVHYIAKKGT